MLNNIIKFSLNNRFFILLCAVILTITGIRTAREMDIDVFPDLTAPTVVIMTDAEDMAAEEVEKLVTWPIESAVNGSTGVRRVRSSSGLGYSFVWVEFDWDTNVLEARQVISEKLIQVSAQMPEGVGLPILAPQSSVMGEVYFIGLRSDSTSLMDLRTIADWEIKPLLLATSGVSQVTVIGGDYKQYQVLADPQKMGYFNVSLDELAEACRGSSKNSSGNVIRQYGNEYVVRGIARTADTDEIGRTFIKRHNSRAVTISDVAEVVIESAVKMGHASINAKPGVILSVSKQPNTNTLKLTEAIDLNLATLQKTLPPDVELDTQIFRQADFIETAVRNVKNSLIEGSIFVAIVLFIFLGSARTTVISLIAIPLSLLGTILAMKLLNININTMSLGGMAIAIGSLVDDAIIDVENVYKRLRQNHAKVPEEKQPVLTIVYEASREIRASIFNATLIIIVAFIPLFFLSGMEGRMLKPLGVAFIVSLSISLIVAMTLTPLLCNIFLTNSAYLTKNEKEKWLVRKLISGYEKFLSSALRYSKTVICSILLLFIFAILLFSRMGRSFLPEFNEGALTLAVVTQPGTSLEENNKLGHIVETELLSIPEITSTARRTGRGELDEHSQATNSAEIDVNFTLDERSQSDFMVDVREKLSGIPGIAFTVGQPLGHRIDHMISGTRANIAVKLFGDNLNTLYDKANEISREIQGIPGLVDINVEQQIEVPQIQIRANRDMMTRYGISTGNFSEFVNIALGGGKMADIYEGQRSFDLILRMNKDYTDNLDGIRNVLIDTDNGSKVPLSQVADIVSAMGPGTVSRENVQRKIVISANIAGSDLRSAVMSIQEKVENNINLPEGYRIEYGGQFENEARASRTLLITSILAIFIIFLLLFQEFRDFKLSGIILINLPLALIGGVFAIYFTSGIISIPSIIGFITLFGIATRNGILLISSYTSLTEAGESLKTAVIKGSSDRLNPILMTAISSALALIPLAWNGDMAGNEIQSPMAKVILGGLITSTILNMYIIPLVFSYIKQPKHE